MVELLDCLGRGYAPPCFIRPVVRRNTSGAKAQRTGRVSYMPCYRVGAGCAFNPECAYDERGSLCSSKRPRMQYLTAHDVPAQQELATPEIAVRHYRARRMLNPVREHDDTKVQNIVLACAYWVYEFENSSRYSRRHRGPRAVERLSALHFELPRPRNTATWRHVP